jgi:hypothetical protein
MAPTKDAETKDAPSQRDVPEEKVSVLHEHSTYAPLEDAPEENPPSGPHTVQTPGTAVTITPAKD